MTKDLAPAEPQAASVPAINDVIVAAIRDPTIDPARLRAFLDFQREVKKDDAKAAFVQARIRLQGRLPRVTKKGEVLFENKKTGVMEIAYKYARWEDIDTAIRGILREEGFSLSFNTAERAEGKGGGVAVIGTLMHEDGHAETADFGLPLDTGGGKNNLQGYASSVSFGQRYVTKMLLNLVFEGDDDDAVKGGMPETITEDQAEVLRKLAKEVDADLDRWLAYMKAPSIAMIPAGKFEDARKSLEMKRGKK